MKVVLLAACLTLVGGPAAMAQPQAAVTSDLGWAAQAFAPAEEGTWRERVAWARAEQARQTDKVREEVANQFPEAKPELGCYRSLICEAVLEVDRLRPQFATAQAFDDARRTAALVGQTLKTSQRAFDAEFRRVRPDDVYGRLRVHALKDQAIRSVYVDLISKTSAVQLTPSQRDLAALMVRMQVIESDLASAADLDRLLETQGWPAAGREDGTPRLAWLAAQHADRRPALQLKALRAMEDIDAARGPLARNYAYLFDRVQLNLTGHQRYGTQFECKSGKVQSSPLEDSEKVESLRKAMGLEPLSTYLSAGDSAC